MNAPDPHGAVPSARQLAWHDLELYGFVHFTLNTFTGKEWGIGDESPSLFDPTDFDADAIAGLAATAGLRGLIVTAKHHDGFCLWPSAHTEHCVRNSPFRGGKGDVVGELAAACRKAGIKFGVYLSPWDRNHAEYGRPAYIEYYVAQLRELLSGYGEVFEVWFDGANGGDGWYGGARETRKIDRERYYPWDRINALVRGLQPGACVFGDGGPDVRWVGNERGVAGDPCWATMDARTFVPGVYDVATLNHGRRGADCWIPAECDVSIRPGWFWHRSQDLFVKSPRRLLDIYHKSVGRGASMLLNLPPDRRGRIGERDRASLLAFGARLSRVMAKDLARGGGASGNPVSIAASNTRGGLDAFAARRALDGDPSTYWATDDGVHEATLTLDFPDGIAFDGFGLREAIALGQRIDWWRLEARSGGAWRLVASGGSIGARRLWRGRLVKADSLRLGVRAGAPLALRELALYRWR